MQESIVETLKNMKSEQNLTLQQISSASGVPLSTVNRILSGQTENPSFRDVAAIVAAMDGSLDAITGLQKLESENGQLLDSNVMQLLLSMQNYYAKTLDATRQQYMRELESKDKQYRDILTDKNRWLRRMFFCLIGMLAVISFLLIVDFINPTIGVVNSSSRCSSPLKSSTAFIASSSGTPAVTAAVNATEMLYKLCFPIKVVFTRSRGTAFPQTYIFSPSIPHPFLSFANMTCCFAPSNIEMSMFSQVELTMSVSFSV